jgi:glycosyltransferase involved in cell wall biosynthesis
MRIIIDITQLAGWQGKLTGIPRVMYELSSRYAKQSDDVHFIGWDEGRGVFWELSFDDMRKRYENNVDDTQIIQNNIQKSTPHFKGLLRATYNKSPGFIKQAARTVKRTIVSKSPIVDLSTAFSFGQGDKLFVLWGEWNSESYINKLVEVVQNYKVKLYQFAHDMLPLVTPQYSSHSTEGLRKYATAVYPICYRIIAISQHTKKDIIDWMGQHKLKSPPINVIRLGDNFNAAVPRRPQNNFFSHERQYVLTVGTIESRKNHALLYYVYKLAKARNITLPPLVVVGRRGWLTENIYDLMTTDPDTKDQFIFLHNADDNELAWLYDHSLFTVYPSHYEGWGLPIAESIARSVPCIASNTSSMSEIAGDIVNYFSPYSTDECLIRMVELTDNDYRKKVKHGLGQYKLTSWDDTFRQVEKITGDDNE